MSVIEEKKALRTYIRQTERTLDPAYKAESSEAICRCVLALEEYRAAADEAGRTAQLRQQTVIVARNTGPRGPCSPLPAPSMRSTPRCC